MPDNRPVTVDRKWFAAVLVPLITWFGYTIWWASGLSSEVVNMRSLMQEQGRRLERIEQFFMRPPGRP